MVIKYLKSINFIYEKSKVEIKLPNVSGLLPL